MRSEDEIREEMESAEELAGELEDSEEYLDSIVAIIAYRTLRWTLGEGESLDEELEKVQEDLE